MKSYFWRLKQYEERLEMSGYRQLGTDVSVIEKYQILWCTIDALVPHEVSEQCRGAQQKSFAVQTANGMELFVAANV